MNWLARRRGTTGCAPGSGAALSGAWGAAHEGCVAGPGRAAQRGRAHQGSRGSQEVTTLLVALPRAASTSAEMVLQPLASCVGEQSCSAAAVSAAQSARARRARRSMVGGACGGWRGQGRAGARCVEPKGEGEGLLAAAAAAAAAAACQAGRDQRRSRANPTVHTPCSTAHGQGGGGEAGRAEAAQLQPAPWCPSAQ